MTAVILDLFLSAAAALVLTIVFSAALGRTGPFGAVSFFFTTFLVSWASGIWIAPMVSDLLGSYRYAFPISGTVFALFIAALPGRERRPVRRPDDISGALSRGLFLLFVVILLAAAALGYRAFNETATNRGQTGFIRAAGGSEPAYSGLVKGIRTAGYPV